jgi:hypothetical protein
MGRSLLYFTALGSEQVGIERWRSDFKFAALDPPPPQILPP